MNIPNIQIAQGLFRTVEERFNSRKENISSQNTASVPQVPKSEELEKKVDSSISSGEKDLIAVVYPPFFPIGNTQDILSIVGVRQLAGEDVTSKSIESVDERKAIQQKNYQNKATNANADVAPRENAGSIKANVKNEAQQAMSEAKPGVVLDLKV